MLRFRRRCIPLLPHAAVPLHHLTLPALPLSRPVSQSFVQCTQRLTEATGLVMQTVSAQHAAYCELLIGGKGCGCRMPLKVFTFYGSHGRIVGR